MRSRQRIFGILAGLILTASTAVPALAEAAPADNAVAVPPATSTSPDAVAPSATTAPPAETADASAWESVIDGQIDAFQKGDAPRAFSYAGAAFQKSFTDPAVFMMSIASSGYTPIFTSVSHSFGKFSQPDANTVVQEVHFIGAKQELYEAVYALGLEAGNWRVLGVQLRKTEGMGI